MDPGSIETVFFRRPVEGTSVLGGASVLGGTRVLEGTSVGVRLLVGTRNNYSVIQNE